MERPSGRDWGGDCVGGGGIGGAGLGDMSIV